MPHWIENQPSAVDDHDWIDCWDCGGEGFYLDSCECEAFEDICCCLTPTPRRCSTCKGKGGWIGGGDD